ncbi:hypothetical protein FOWG_17709 [Fusarium oxysporum f. sp. lycopersici MN25]|nr:hypothetical protein FOWG_17709 [Fusarium oxysporum f. sp. lycopersici MN25]
MGRTKLWYWTWNLWASNFRGKTCLVWQRETQTG